MRIGCKTTKTPSIIFKLPHILFQSCLGILFFLTVILFESWLDRLLKTSFSLSTCSKCQSILLDTWHWKFQCIALEPKIMWEGKLPEPFAKKILLLCHFHVNPKIQKLWPYSPFWTVTYSPQFCSSNHLYEKGLTNLKVTLSLPAVIISLCILISWIQIIPWHLPYWFLKPPGALLIFCVNQAMPITQDSLFLNVCCIGHMACPQNCPPVPSVAGFSRQIIFQSSLLKSSCID